VRAFGLLQEVVKAARELRADNQLDPKATIEATLYLHSAQFAETDLAVIATLVKLNLEQRAGKLGEHKGLIRSVPEFDLQLYATPPTAERNGSAGGDSRARILKEIESFEKLIVSSGRQLSDEAFLSKAPEKVVASLRAKLAGYREQLAKNKKLLDNLTD
jgi:valyl-tRNA synthetase